MESNIKNTISVEVNSFTDFDHLADWFHHSYLMPLPDFLDKAKSVKVGNTFVQKWEGIWIEKHENEWRVFEERIDFQFLSSLEIRTIIAMLGLNWTLCPSNNKIYDDEGDPVFNTRNITLEMILRKYYRYGEVKGAYSVKSSIKKGANLLLDALGLELKEK